MLRITINPGFRRIIWSNSPPQVSRVVTMIYGAGMSVRRLGGNDLYLIEELFAKLPHSPFFIKDRDFRYVAANEAMASLCGVKRPKDIEGKRAADFFPYHLARRYEALDQQVMESGCALVDQLEITTPTDADAVWLLFSRIPVKAENGAIVGLAGISQRLKDSDKSSPLYQRLSKAAAMLRDSIDQPLCLEQLSAKAGVSKSQLQRDFVKLFGMTPGAFLHQARMEHAKRLLKTESPIAAIAYECGYTDQSAFTRRFRQFVGISPTAYRQQFTSPAE